MALTKTNYPLKSIVAATETDLVNVSNISTIATVTICNTTAGAAVVEMVLTDDVPAALAQILKSKSIAATTTEVLDIRSLNISATQRLRVESDITGVEFIASGVEYV
jgi:hypothetical protein